MTPSEAALSIKEWVRDLLTQVRARSDQIDTRLTKLEDRANAAEPRLLTRREYEVRHADLERLSDARLKAHEDDADRRFSHVEQRLRVIEAWKSNITGRVVGVGFVGVVVTAAITALIAHLAGGG